MLYSARHYMFCGIKKKKTAVHQKKPVHRSAAEINTPAARGCRGDVEPLFPGRPPPAAAPVARLGAPSAAAHPCRRLL